MALGLLGCSAVGFWDLKKGHLWAFRAFELGVLVGGEDSHFLERCLDIGLCGGLL